MQNFTKEESSALLYLKLARDLGANNISINKSTCEVIINLVERLMQKANDEQAELLLEKINKRFAEQDETINEILKICKENNAILSVMLKENSKRF